MNKVNQLEKVRITAPYNLVKYPFLQRLYRYITTEMNIKELVSPEYAEIIKRAETRVREAILHGVVGPPVKNNEIEISSFPVAVLMVASTKDKRIMRAFSLAEAKRMYEFLIDEKTEIILNIARFFGWKIRLLDKLHRAKNPYEFAVNFRDYVKNAVSIQDKKWKLVNRFVVKGEVYLTKREVCRLLQEEIRRYIEEKLDTEVDVTLLPFELQKKVESLKNLFTEIRGKIPSIGTFPNKVVIEAFPPCIKALYDMLSSGRHLSHIGRFTLTSFLVNIGMPTESIVDLFRNLSDFNERLTRYQVEHIAGERGSRTRYTPPKCETLKTHGVCQNPDELCRRVYHPLSYYRKKIRREKEVKKMA